MIMKTLLGLVCCFFLVNAIAQDSSVAPKDSIVVRKDSRLDMLNTHQAKLNKMASKYSVTGMYHGYRLQVLTTQSREKAFELKGDLLSRFPEQKTYALFQSPNFKIRFGNFIEKADAERYRKILTNIYAQGIYIISDEVEYTPPKEEDTTSQK